MSSIRFYPALRHITVRDNSVGYWLSKTRKLYLNGVLLKQYTPDELIQLRQKYKATL